MSQALLERIAATDVLLKKHLAKGKRLTAAANKRFATARSPQAAQALRDFERLTDAAGKHRFGTFTDLP